MKTKGTPPPNKGTFKSKEKMIAEGMSPKEADKAWKEHTEKAHQTKIENARRSEIFLNALMDGISGNVKDKNGRIIENRQILQEFVTNFMKEARLRPNSSCGRMLATAIGLNESLPDRLDKWINQQQKQDLDFKSWRIRKLLTESQGRLFDLNHEMAIFHHGRRFGKSFVCAAKVLQVSGIENQPSIIVHKNLRNGLDQYWANIHEIAKETGINITRADRTTGTIHFEGGGFVDIRGHDSKYSADAIRGGHYKLSICEEGFFHTGNLKYLIEDVLIPASAQHSGRQIIISSTPPRSKVKYFEHLKETVPCYTGTMLDNSKIPDAHSYYYQQQKERGQLISWEREFAGMWKYDTEALVFHPKDWVFNESEIINPNVVIGGIDFGTNDYNAIVFIAGNTVSKKFWLIKEDKWNETGAIESMERFKQNYIEVCEWAVKRGITKKIFIEMDTDQKMIGMNLFDTHKLPVEIAIKTDRVLNIHKVDDLLRTGQLLLPKDSQCYDECESTVWLRSGETDELIDKFDDSVYHPDAMMAVVYAMNRLMFDLRI